MGGNLPPRDQIDDRGEFTSFAPQTEKYLTLPDEELGRAETYNPHKARGRGFKLGLLVAGLATAGGVTFGVLNKGDAEAKPDPVATAPLNPGVGEATAPPTTETSTNPADWTNSTVPLYYEGERLQGTAALAEAVSVSAEEYSTPQEGMTQIVAELNKWLNHSFTPEEEALYAQYQSKDQNRYVSGGILQDYYNDAVTAGLTGTPDKKASTDNMTSPAEWFAANGGLALQNNSYRAATKNDKQPYEAKYTIDKMNMLVNVDNQAMFGLDVTYKDNAALNTIGKYRSEPGGYDGITEETMEEKRRLEIMIDKSSGEWRIVSLTTGELPSTQ
jgi:hypothetical protein